MKYRCPECLQDVSMTVKGKWRQHGTPPCKTTGQQVPAHLIIAGGSDESDDRPVKGRGYDECPACGRMPRLDADGNLGAHSAIKGEDDPCPMSGKSLRPVKPLPGTTKYLDELKKATELPTAPCPEPGCGRTPTVENGKFIAHMGIGWGDKVCPMSGMPIKSPRKPTTEESPPITGTISSEPESTESDPPILTTGTISSDPVKCGLCGQTKENGYHECYPIFKQPDASPDLGVNERFAPPEFGELGQPLRQEVTASGKVHIVTPFVQPDPVPKALSPLPMSVMAEQVTAMMKQLFFDYSNRMARNVQTTLGPSEIGTPCDRRLAMSLLQIPPVNPGGDNWASFKGTCVHVGLAEMFDWANANTGRFATEVPLTFPSALVPHGTSDLLDRMLFMVDDHKTKGRWSMDKLRTKGPTETERIQLHTYALGQRIRGEKIDYVALIGWPMESSSLADMYVWCEPYNPNIAHKALLRVEDIDAQLNDFNLGPDSPSRTEVIRSFPVADDCRYCPFFASGDVLFERGCNGNR